MRKQINIQELTADLENAVELNFTTPDEKKFVISRVPTAAVRLYAKLRSDAIEATHGIVRVNNILKRAEELKEDENEEKAKLLDEATALTKNFKGKDEDYLRIQNTILKIILTANNYDYNKKFWDIITQREKQEFIIQSIQKDIPAVKKKS